MAAELKRLQESNSVERADAEPERKRQAVGKRSPRFPSTSNLSSKSDNSEAQSNNWTMVTSKTASKPNSKASNTASKLGLLSKSKASKTASKAGSKSKSKASKTGST